MGIFLKHSYNVKPPRWGSPADVQYAIKVNAEKIYQVDPDNIVLAMPLFWGFPCLDYSGNNNNGTNHGTTYKDRSLYCNGNDYIEIPDSDFWAFGDSTDFTIELWFKANDWGSDWWNRAFMGHSEGGGAVNKWYFYKLSAAGSLQVHINSPSGSNDAPSSDDWTADLSVWYYITLTRSGNIWTYYKDGNAIGGGTKTTAMHNANGPLIIAKGEGASNFFMGSIKQTRISYNVAHTANQIALFHALPYGLYQPVSRPVYFFQAAVGGLSIPVAMSHYLRQMGA